MRVLIGYSRCPITVSLLREGTPYNAAEEAHNEWWDDPARTTLRDDARAAAREEVAFLRSLLPEGEAP